MANQNSKKKNTKKPNTKANTNNKKVVAKKDEKVVKEAKKVAPKKDEKVVKSAKKVEPKKEVKDIKVPKFEKKEEKKEKVVKEKKSFSLTAKQKDLILVLLVVVLLVVAFLLTMNKNEAKLDIELPVALEGTAGFNEITYSEYIDKMDSETPFVVVIIKDGCGYCEMYEPVVKEVAEEYNLPINYINLAHLSEEEYSALGSSNSYLKKNEWGTPTTLFMVGNSVVDSIGGYVEKDELVNFVKENFVVK